jgi:hypothetical protein
LEKLMTLTEPKPQPMSVEQFTRAVDVLRFNKPPASIGEDQDVARVRLGVVRFFVRAAPGPTTN